jgi:transcriptional regulator GlxA family with amidase domain
LLLQVLRVHYDAQTHPEGFFAGLRDTRLSRAISRIHADYARPLTLADLATSAAMSRSAFAQHFSTVVRMSPIDYLQLWRMLVARDLLQSTDRPVCDIAETVGYGSDISFSRAYKRRFGVSPSFARSDAASALVD